MVVSKETNMVAIGILNTVQMTKQLYAIAFASPMAYVGLLVTGMFLSVSSASIDNDSFFARINIHIIPTRGISNIHTVTGSVCLFKGEMAFSVFWMVSKNATVTMMKMTRRTIGTSKKAVCILYGL